MLAESFVFQFAIQKYIEINIYRPLREERKLRVFQNMVLRIFGPRRDEVTGEWRRLHNEELNDLYCTPNIVRVIKIEKNEMGWACGTYGRGEGGV